MTQKERILRHLRGYGSITQLEALKEYGIMRLSSRVSDLKAEGYPIRREMVSSKTDTTKIPAMPGILWMNKGGIPWNCLIF